MDRYAAGVLGNNLKDRSSGTIIRYNWIEGGNRQLDLVETDYAHIADDSAYQETFVYGNLLIEPEGAGNSQILHFGGDGGDIDMYRRGTLYFYHNTVVSTRSSNTTLMRLSTTDVHADVMNNILYAFAGGNHLAITSGNGQTRLFGNWLPDGWQITHEAGLEEGAAIIDLGNQEGLAPGFVDENNQDFPLEHRCRRLWLCRGPACGYGIKSAGSSICRTSAIRIPGFPIGYRRI